MSIRQQQVNKQNTECPQSGQKIYQEIISAYFKTEIDGNSVPYMLYFTIIHYLFKLKQNDKSIPKHRERARLECFGGIINMHFDEGFIRPFLL